MLDGVHHVTGAGFALGTNHGCAFCDAAQGFSQVARAADERSFEAVLVNVVSFVGWSQHFGFVNVVHTEFLQDLCFREVSDAALGHDRNGHRRHDLSNFFRRCHAGHAAFGSNLRGNALQRHHRHGAGLFGNSGLVGVGDIHDDAALQHFR